MFHAENAPKGLTKFSTKNLTLKKINIRNFECYLIMNFLVEKNIPHIIMVHFYAHSGLW